MFISGWTDNQNVEQPQNGILVIHIRKGNSDTTSMGLQATALSEISQSQKSTYDVI